MPDETIGNHLEHGPFWEGGDVHATLDYRCSTCGVGINHGEETFNHKQTQVYCKSCAKERRKDGSTLVDVLIPCLEKLAAYSGCDLSKELEELHKLT